MQQANHILSYFDPTTNKYEGSWSAFDTELSFKQQLITITLTAIATFLTLPILGLGGLAAFRALVNHYTPLNPDDLPSNPMGTAAQKTQKKSEEVFHEMTELEFVEKALTSFEYSGDSEKEELESLLLGLYAKYGNPATLLGSFKLGTKKERREILECAMKLDGSFNSAHEFKRLMRFAASIKSAREEKLEKLKPYCIGLRQTSDIQHIDRKLKDLPADEEEEILSAFALISTQFVDAVDRAECLIAIKANIDVGKRVEVIRENLDLLQFVNKSFYLIKVLKNVSLLPAESREHVLSLTAKLHSKDDRGLTLDKILRCVQDTPQVMHQQLLNNIETCLEGISGESILPVVQILDQVLRLDASERVDVVGVAMSHINSRMAPYERRLIMSALLDVNADSRNVIDDQELQEMIKVKKQIIQFFSKLSSGVDKQEIFAEINRIPENQREALFADLAPALERIHSAAAFKELINGAKMIAPQHRASVIENYHGVLDGTFTWLNLVQYAFERHSQGREILTASKHYLRVLLEQETDERVARDIAQKIYANRHTFGVAEDGGDELLAVLLAIVDFEEGDESGSFGLFRSLIKKDREVKTPAIDTPRNTVIPKIDIRSTEADAQARTIPEIKVRLNQPFFEKSVREALKITYGDLPETINMKTLTEMFTAFEKRMAQLNPDDRREAWTVGVSGCMLASAAATRNPSEGTIRDSYTSTKSTFLESAYIKDMLARTGDPQQQVSTGYLHLYAVIRYIKESSTKVNPKTRLSDQEEILLKMLSSVQNCGTGKSEGLAEFYSSLPAEARFQGNALGEKRADKAKMYLSAVVQSLLAKYLEDYGDMAKELTGRPHDGQWVHTRKYLKNLIAKRVGLQWDIAYDSYPGCIDGNLKNKSLDEVMRIFYKHITPEKFLKDVLQRVRGDIVPNADEIQKIEARLLIAQAELDAKLKEGQMPALLVEQKKLTGARQDLFLAKHQTAQKLRALKESEEAVDQQKIARAEQAKRFADQKWAEWQENNKRVQAALEAEKERLGIPALEARVEAIEEELDAPLEKVNQALVDQLSALLTESKRDGIETAHCWSPVASAGYRNTITARGMANVLIEAGYFAQV